MVWTLFLLYSPFLPAPSSSQGATDYSNRGFPAAIFSWTSWPVLLLSSLPHICMRGSTQTSMKAFSILCMLHSTYIQASSSLFHSRDGSLEQTARFVLETAFPRCTFPPIKERKSACACAGYAAPMLQAQLRCRKEAAVYSFMFSNLGSAYLLCKHEGSEGLQVSLWRLQTTTRLLDGQTTGLSQH